MGGHFPAVWAVPPRELRAYQHPCPWEGTVPTESMWGQAGPRPSCLLWWLWGSSRRLWVQDVVLSVEKGAGSVLGDAACQCPVSTLPMPVRPSEGLGGRYYASSGTVLRFCAHLPPLSSCPVCCCPGTSPVPCSTQGVLFPLPGRQDRACARGSRRADHSLLMPLPVALGVAAINQAIKEGKAAQTERVLRNPAVALRGVLPNCADGYQQVLEGAVARKRRPGSGPARPAPAPHT